MREQLFRFALAGAFVTFLSAFIYVVGTNAFGVPPLLANFYAHILSVLVGFRIHCKWTFADQARTVADDLVSVRFLIASISPLLLNSLWAWLLTPAVTGSVWYSVLPMLIVTPLASFLINRRWVFA